MFSKVHISIAKAPITILLVSFSLAAFVNAQVAQSSPAGSALKSIAGLVGKVFNADGHPAPGVRVELQEPDTGLPLKSTYTEPDGSFHLPDVPKGNYDVVAESTDSQVSDQVSVQPGRPRLELRFSREAGEQVRPPTVSVAQMMVPESARRAYAKARNAMFERNDAARATKFVNEALQIEPQFPEALSLRGLLELRNRQFDEAQQSLQQAITIDPNATTAYVLLASLYNHMGRFDEALQASGRAIALAPDAWQGYLEMAKASIAKNMYQNAVRLVARAEKAGGTPFAEVHLVRAYALLPLKHYSDARHEIDATLSREPKGQLADLARNLLSRITTQETATLEPPKSLEPSK